MRIETTCVTCVNEDILKGIDISKIGVPFYTAELNNDLFAEVKCQRNHVSRTVLQASRFEIYFDISISALKAGYESAAILHAFTSVERFFEFFYFVVAQDRGLDWGALVRLRSSVKLSERAFGAYCFSRFLTSLSGTSPLNTKEIDELRSLRNRVAHSGYIPKYDEAFEYLERVYNFVTADLSWLKITLRESVGKQIAFEVGEAYKSACQSFDGNQISTFGVPTAFSVVSRTGSGTFENIFASHPGRIYLERAYAR